MPNPQPNSNGRLCLLVCTHGQATHDLTGGSSLACMRRVVRLNTQDGMTGYAGRNALEVFCIARGLAQHGTGLLVCCPCPGRSANRVIDDCRGPVLRISHLVKLGRVLRSASAATRALGRTNHPSNIVTALELRKDGEGKGLEPPLLFIARPSENQRVGAR